ncbi:MAG: Asp-tRNA(Asn)/Glu-tRNA(Gln) amidotransferase subunit GatC [bacterium]|nr:Asp-tRNA(Asn)/Glu-tRNA(Gln) amidotransferase subunit GatC [bacterium]MDZ4205679.1 Asp-tRNA(Asn)/Glu-tRNA(Gln) amidotransferase subunit GatC [Patescibacteria group bacterium]
MNKDEVFKLAKLARIEIGEVEAENLTREFEAILDYVGEIKNTRASPLMLDFQSETLKNVMREDVEPHEPGLYTKKILEQAPAKEGDYIKVKKIL